jgi:hypothetical protein
MNTLKMVFPEGVELTTKPRKPAFKSCYIAIRDDSLDKHMLSFVLFSEQLSAEGVEAYNLNNFKMSKDVYADRAIGLVSKHHDNYTAEKILRYILDYVGREAVDMPVEVQCVQQRVICNLIDEVHVKVDHVTIFNPLPDLLDPKKPCTPISIVSTPRMPNISVGLGDAGVRPEEVVPCAEHREHPGDVQEYLARARRLHHRQELPVCVRHHRVDDGPDLPAQVGAPEDLGGRA